MLVLFFIAVAFLGYSMNKHLKRVPASFPPPGRSAGSHGPTDETAPNSTAQSTTATTSATTDPSTTTDPSATTDPSTTAPEDTTRRGATDRADSEHSD